MRTVDPLAAKTLYDATSEPRGPARPRRPVGPRRVPRTAGLRRVTARALHRWAERLEPPAPPVPTRC
ncbi:hypothetical protein FTX61_01680 [Nitriliruptoraceae bacterium ZYF776]|nr:hypothetical protein [Profundirhabdus halotolerans]